MPVPDIPPNPVRINIPEPFPPYVLPEFLPEADWVRAFYRQSELTIPCHLPRFSYGWKYRNHHDYVVCLMLRFSDYICLKIKMQ